MTQTLHAKPPTHPTTTRPSQPRRLRAILSRLKSRVHESGSTPRLEFPHIAGDLSGPRACGDLSRAVAPRVTCDFAARGTNRPRVRVPTCSIRQFGAEGRAAQIALRALALRSIDCRSRAKESGDRRRRLETDELRAHVPQAHRRRGVMCTRRGQRSSAAERTGQRLRTASSLASRHGIVSQPHGTEAHGRAEVHAPTLRRCVHAPSPSAAPATPRDSPRGPVGWATGYNRVGWRASGGERCGSAVA
jgi:hypothetical protein